MPEETSDRKAPGFWFYPGDFERDMLMLPLDSQGLWIRMLCWASENEMHRGFLELPTGESMTERDIANRVGKDLRTVQRCLAVMRRIGTFSEDDRGTIFCRRMARDSHISAVRKQAAQKRQLSVERAKTGEFVPPKPPAKDEQIPTVTASVSDSASTIEEEPPKPPAPMALALAPKKGHRKNGNHQRSSEEIRKALGPERGKWWDAFSSVFPCREGMKAGMDTFERKVHDRELAVKIFRGAERYAKQYAADPTMKLKYSQGWINEERYEDENRIAEPIPRKNGQCTIDELADSIEAFGRTR